MSILRIAALLATFSLLMFANPSDTGVPAVTPEPSMVVLLAAGLTGIGVAAWRRNRKR